MTVVCFYEIIQDFLVFIEGTESFGLILLHEAAVSRNICVEDCCEFSFESLISHKIYS